MSGQWLYGEVARLDREARKAQVTPHAPSPAGWYRAETWTYASATSATVAGDVSSKIGAGDKIRFKQSAGTWQYGYVDSVSYDSGSDTTTITVQMCDGSALADEAITDNAYSKVATPQGFPDNAVLTTGGGAAGVGMSIVAAQDPTLRPTTSSTYVDVPNITVTITTAVTCTLYIEAICGVKTDVGSKPATVALHDGTTQVYARSTTETVQWPSAWKIVLASQPPGTYTYRMQMKAGGSGAYCFVAGASIAITAIQDGNEMYSVDSGDKWVYFQTPAMSTSYDGDSVSSGRTIDLSAVFGIPDGVRAVLVGFKCTSGTSGRYASLGPNSTYRDVLQCMIMGSSSETESDGGVVPCDANGDVYLHVSGAINVYIRIYGYLPAAGWGA